MKQIRLKLVLGKFLVSNVSRTVGGHKFTLTFPGLGQIHVDVGFDVDVKEGDLLTLYTEVLSDAKSRPTPIQ